MATRRTAGTGPEAGGRSGTWLAGTWLAVAAPLVVTLMALALVGCMDSMPRLQDLNPFATKEPPLPGKRIPVLHKEEITSDAAAAGRPVSLPSPRANNDWSQPGGATDNAPGHLAFGGGALKQVWSVSIGTGSSFYGKLTGSPIVYGGRVYALDAEGHVTAVSASGGSVVWRASTTPPTEKDHEGFGGGLAADGGRIYAATGFGTVVALDASSGKKLWERNLGAPLRASPTAASARVFAMTKEGKVFCLSASDGAELWHFAGAPEGASILVNTSPAVEDDTVVVPYPTGDVVALNMTNGQPVWQESLARARVASPLGAMSDAARPAIYSGVVYAVGHGGRMVATALKSGEQLWSITVASIQQPWVAGDTVFVMDTGGQVVAITRSDGKVRWASKLPGAGTWSGPVLAGNRLWLVSSKGELVGADPINGRVASTLNIGSPVLIAPVVAAGRMFVLTDNARLLAFQ